MDGANIKHRVPLFAIEGQDPARTPKEVSGTSISGSKTHG